MKKNLNQNFVSAMNTRMCILNSEDEEEAEMKVIAQLKDSLNCRVATLRHISDVKNACSNGHATETYNSVIAFHGCVKEKNVIPLTSLIDLHSPGMIIHVILQAQTEEKEYLYKIGSKIISQNIKFNKGQVVIYWNQITEYQKLVAIISNVMFSDNAFADQILFL